MFLGDRLREHIVQGGGDGDGRSRPGLNANLAALLRSFRSRPGVEPGVGNEHRYVVETHVICSAHAQTPTTGKGTVGEQHL